MSSHGLSLALALYRDGTLTLRQAAGRAGLSEDEFAAALRKRGLSLRPAPPDATGAADADESDRESTGAD